MKGLLNMLLKSLKSLWIELSNHNRYKVLGFLFSLLLLLVCYSCESHCDSVLHPGKRITRTELISEIETFNTEAAHEANSLDRQDAIKAFLLESAITAGQTATFNWWNFAAIAGSILGVGATADNIRYRIKKA